MKNPMLSIRDSSNCIEFPIFPLQNKKTQEIRGHVTFPSKELHIKHDLSYVMDKIYSLNTLDVKEVTIHTLGLNLTTLCHISSITNKLGIQLNIENRRVGRTSRIDDLRKILWATGAGLTLDVGHTESNNQTEAYVKEFREVIRNVHLYKTETEKGHIPFSNSTEFVNVFYKVTNLPNLDWIVLEADNVTEIIKWYTYFIMG